MKKNWTVHAAVFLLFGCLSVSKGAIELSVANVNVQENSEARFFVRLDSAPVGAVTVSVSRISGDPGLNVTGGALLTFRASSWSRWQTVTLSALDDANSINETATFEISSPDMPSQSLVATALDDDIGINLVLASTVKTITPVNAGSGAKMLDGITTSLVNWGYTVWTSVPPGNLTLDFKTGVSVSRIRLQNYDWDKREQRYLIEGSADGSVWSTLADASGTDRQSWDDWPVANAEMRYVRITGLSCSTSSLVQFGELEVYGAWMPVPEVSTPTNVNVREDGEGRFFVRLNSSPLGTSTVTVNVAWSAGDASLAVKSGATLAFKTSNWSTWQPVTLSAPADANTTREKATFKISSKAALDQFMGATTLDIDNLGTDLALSSAGSTIAGRGSVVTLSRVIDGIHMVSTNYGSTVWTSAPPATMTLDLKRASLVSRIRVLNSDWIKQEQRYQIEGSTDGATWSLLADASGSDRRGWDDWAYTNAVLRYVRLTGLSNSVSKYVNVAECEVYGYQIPLLEVSRSNLNVQEESEARFFVRLESAPVINMTVTVSRLSGNTNLNVTSGESLIFKPSNWSKWYPVTLAAAADANSVNETAIFQVSTPNVTSKFVTATSLDNDGLGTDLALASGGTKIHQEPTGGGTRMIDGITTSSVYYGFTTWTDSPPVSLTLTFPKLSMISRVRALNYDWILQEQRYKIESSEDGAAWSMLVDASGTNHWSWSDWPIANVAARYVRFTGLSNSIDQFVKISELEIYGEPMPEIELSVTSNMNVQEASEGRFWMRLSSPPVTNITVSVSRISGDANLNVTGGAPLVFKPSNWSKWYAVTLSAAVDANSANETARFMVSAQYVTSKYVTATALDIDNIGTNVALAAAGTTVKQVKAGGGTRMIDGTNTSSTYYGYTTWTNDPPGTLTLDLKSAKTITRIRALNFDWIKQVQQYQVRASLDNTNWTVLVDASAGDHTGWEDWPLAPVSFRYVRLTGVSNSVDEFVKVSELEVYGPVGGRRLAAINPPLQAKAAPVQTQAAPAAGAGAVATVVTSDDGPEHADGWAVVDGDPRTLWAGSAAAKSWYVVVGYGTPQSVSDVQVDVADGSQTNFQFLYSTDADHWFPLQEDLADGPVWLNYLWLLMPSDGTPAVPQVREIRLIP